MRAITVALSVDNATGRIEVPHLRSKQTEAAGSHSSDGPGLLAWKADRRLAAPIIGLAAAIQIFGIRHAQTNIRKLLACPNS
jgi:hypothetical protein